MVCSTGLVVIAWPIIACMSWRRAVRSSSIIARICYSRVSWLVLRLGDELYRMLSLIKSLRLVLLRYLNDISSLHSSWLMRKDIGMRAWVAAQHVGAPSLQVCRPPLKGACVLYTQPERCTYQKFLTTILSGLFQCPSMQTGAPAVL